MGQRGRRRGNPFLRGEGKEIPGKEKGETAEVEKGDPKRTNAFQKALF